MSPGLEAFDLGNGLGVHPERRERLFQSPFEPSGSGVVTLPTERVPFGAVVQATAVYPSLRAFLGAMRRKIDPAP